MTTALDARQEVIHGQLGQAYELPIGDGLVLVLVLVAPGADVSLQGRIQGLWEDDPAMALGARLGPFRILFLDLGQVTRGAVRAILPQAQTHVQVRGCQAFVADEIGEQGRHERAGVAHLLVVRNQGLNDLRAPGFADKAREGPVRVVAILGHGGQDHPMHLLHREQAFFSLMAIARGSMYTGSGLSARVIAWLKRFANLDAFAGSSLAVLVRAKPTVAMMSSRGDDKDRGADNRTAKVTEELAEVQLQSQKRYGPTMIAILVTQMTMVINLILPWA